MVNTYKGISKFYDRIVAAGYYDMTQAASEYKKLIGPDTKTVLEIGIGTGTLARLLKNNFQIIGVDCSGALLKIAKSKLANFGIKLIHKNILSIDFNEAFDAVIGHGSIFVVIDSKNGLMVESFVTTKTKIRSALSNIYKALRKNGRFIFDYHPEHDPTKRFVSFDNYKYEFRIKKKDGMNDFYKIHEIKNRSGKIVATSTDHKIRIPLKNFKKIAKHIGFKKVKTALGKYLVLQK